MKNKINDGNGLEHTEYIEKYIYEKKRKTSLQNFN